MSPPRLRSHAEFQACPYFDALDGLRAVSILLVLWHHVPRYPPGHWAVVLQENGRYGVSFFFVISGFLICTLFLREERKTGGIRLGRFYGRRAVRLLPLYYAALAAQAALVFLLHQYTPANQELFRHKLAGYLFYYSNWLPTATAGPFFCAWSLAVEEQFYLVFGLLLFFAPRRWVIGAAVLALATKVAVYAAAGNVDAASTLWRVVFSYQESILLGVLAAFLLDQPRGYALACRWLGRRGTVAALAVALAAWLGLHPMSGQSFWDAQLLYLGMTAVLLGLVIRSRAPVIASRPLVHIGKISYGIYLLHMFFLSTVKKLPGGTQPVVCLVVTSALVIAAASVSHRYFESPLIARARRRLAAGGGAPPVTAGVAAPQPAAPA